MVYMVTITVYSIQYTNIYLFIYSILFPTLFFGGLFGRVVLMSTHIQLAYLSPFVLHQRGEQSLIMLSRQLCFNRFGHVHACIIMFTTLPDS